MFLIWTIETLCIALVAGIAGWSAALASVVCTRRIAGRPRICDVMLVTATVAGWLAMFSSTPDSAAILIAASMFVSQSAT